MYVSPDLAAYEMLWAILDNAVDEHFRGYGNRISIQIHPDKKTVSVRDEGRGIPVDFVPARGKSILEIVFTREPGQGGPRTVRRLPTSILGLEYSLPAAVVCALSTHLQVESTHNHKCFSLSFTEGVVDGPLTHQPNSDSSGTKITFQPDESVLGPCTFEASVISETLQKIHARYPDLNLILNSSAYA